MDMLIILAFWILISNIFFLLNNHLGYGYKMCCTLFCSKDPGVYMLAKFKGDYEKKNKLKKMNILENEKKKAEIEEKFLSSQHLCLSKNWVLQLNQEDQINDYLCLLCKQIANYPVEINCPQHQHSNEPLIVGEHCLKQYLRQNSNNCPVESHEHCKYTKVKLIHRYVSELRVTCPLQFEQDLQTCVQTQQTNEGKETNCNFNGKVKELKEHLENSCSLRCFGCWFKPFGCNHNCHKHELKQHLISNMQFHFDLVLQSFQALKQTLQLLQVLLFVFFINGDKIKTKKKKYFFFFKKEESTQLKLQNEKLRLEMQSKRLRDEENMTIFKGYS
ncbi:hypothetical protein RFI_13488, partial [Reticulomyxa filosa]